MKNINHLGRLHAIHLLKAVCNECNRRADYEIERSNKELPDTHFQGGTRTIYYCEEHFQNDREAKKLWEDMQR